MISLYKKYYIGLSIVKGTSESRITSPTYMSVQTLVNTHTDQADKKKILLD